MKAFIILNSPGDYHSWKSITKYLGPDWEVQYGNHYDNASLKNAFTANVVISSTPYVRQHLELIDEIRSINRNALICIHPHEGFKSYTSLGEYISGRLDGGSGSFRTSKAYRLESVDRYYFWGLTHISEWATTLVAQNGLNPDGIVCTGSVYHDYSVKPRHGRRDIKRILYCSGCMTYGLYADDDFKASGDVLGGDGSLDFKKLVQYRLRDTAIIDRESIYLTLIKFAKVNPGTLVTVRLHPAECEKLKEYETGKNMTQGCKEFSNLLSEMEKLDNITVEDDGLKLQAVKLPEYDCILHHGSTVAIQAAFLRIPSLHIPLENTRQYEQTLPDELKTYETLEVPGRVDISCAQLTEPYSLNALINSTAYKDEFASLIRYANALFRPWHEYTGRTSRKPPLQAIAEDVRNSFESTSKNGYKPIRRPMDASRRFSAFFRILKRLVRSGF